MHIARSATAMVDAWTSRDIMYSLIFSEASHLKPPAGGKLPHEELERSRTPVWDRDLNFCKNWEAVQLLPTLRERAGFTSRALPTSAPRLLFGWHGHSSARAALFILSGHSNQHANRCGSLHANALAHKARCHQPHCKKIRTWKFRGVQISLSSLAET